MKVDLSKNSWKMRGYWPNTPIFGNSMETGGAMGAVTHWMPAKVPGCVMNDLIENGLVKDPYYEMNSLACEWVANRWWVYSSEFAADICWQGQDVFLIFEGIDYKCHIFLNNKLLCKHEGMFEPIRANVSDKVLYDGLNNITVIIESVPDVTGQIGYTSKTNTQTSRFGYKWDFSTRMPHMGIWRDVHLDITPRARIDSAHLITSVDNGRGLVDIDFKLNLKDVQTYKLSAKLCLEDTVVCEQITDIECTEKFVSLHMEVENPKLWWPNGYGDQPLYKLDAKLLKGETICDTYTAFAGIRNLSYSHNENARGALSYIIEINARKIYIKGFNISPLDHLIGSVDYEKYERLIKKVKAANANLIRVWGGGITEQSDFYDLCDRAGILVWQEFNQSSSGIDNVPSKDGAYLKMLSCNAKASILARRNHVCLAVWSGGNELMDEQGVPSTFDDENIAMLKNLVHEYDGIHMFLPTSASGSLEFLDVSEDAQGKNHDVHGPWQYQGPVKQYEMFNKSDSLLHSEFGVDGFTNYGAAVKFLSEENLKPSNVEENLVWRHHGEWWDTTKRDKELFGKCDDLKTMIACSQYVQAEGLRYAVEANRRRAFQNSGSIIWQLNEPWPNIFCTCLMDYYGEPKTAYWWVKRAYAPLAVSLRYDRLIYEPGSVFAGEVWVSDNCCEYNGNVSLKVMDMLGNVHHEKSYATDLRAKHSAKACDVEFAAEGFPYGIFVVELSIDGRKNETPNQYMFSYNGEPAFVPLLKDCICTEVEATIADGDIIVENKGNIAAVNVKIYCEESSLNIDDNCIIVWPNQSVCLGYGDGVSADRLSIDWLNKKDR